MKYLIGSDAQVGSAFSRPCAECHGQIWVAPQWTDFIKRSKPLVVCISCATEFFGGEITAATSPSEDARVFINPAVLRTQYEAASRDLALYAAPNLAHELSPHLGELPGPQGYSSALWVNCPRCASYRGDPCRRGPGYCQQRVETNLLRLENLETWGTLWGTPCHQAPIWLVWRTTSNELSWTGVPCFARGCQMTYSVNLYADELIRDKVPVERINPGLVEMCCWALEEPPELGRLGASSVNVDGWPR